MPELRITTSKIKFDKRQLNSLIAERLNSQIRFATGFVKNKIQNLAHTILKDTDFYREFASGSPLTAELGIPLGEAHSRIDVIVGSIAQSLDIVTNKIGSNQFILNLQIQINLTQESIEFLTSLNSANVNTDNGDRLPWLSWVLKEGDSIIISDYTFMYKAGGRSGSGVMIPYKNWSVPSRYSGTIDDNWITRAFADNEEQILEVLSEVYSAALEKVQ